MFSASVLRNRITALILLSSAGGCASAPPYQILTPFHDDDFRLWAQSGSYTVTGVASYKRADGTVLTCAGETAYLIPAVAYNTELEQLLQSGKGYPPNYDRHARKYNYRTQCDATGRFFFDNIPALNWVVLTRVNWTEPSSMPYMDPEAHGGYLVNEFKVSDNHTAVTLSNEDFFEDRKTGMWSRLFRQP
jgi:hypothetical protein